MPPIQSGAVQLERISKSEAGELLREHMPAEPAFPDVDVPIETFDYSAAEQLHCIAAEMLDKLDRIYHKSLGDILEFQQQLVEKASSCANGHAAASDSAPAEAAG